MAYLTYKFRLYPTAAQAREMGSMLETVRQVYNTALAFRNDYYQEMRKPPPGGALYRAFAAIRNLQIADRKSGGAGPHWLARLPSHAMRDTLGRVDAAFDRYIKGVGQGCRRRRRPRFKSRWRLASIPFNNYPATCGLVRANGRPMSTGLPLRGDIAPSRRGYRLRLYGVGRVKIVVHRGVPGRVKTASLKRDADGKWHLLFVAETPEVAAEPSRGPAVGIDMGLTHFFTTSDGDHEPIPRFLRSKLPALRRLQRSMSRKAEKAKRDGRRLADCRNYQKARLEAARLSVKVRNLRRDHRYRVARRLVGRYSTICVEALQVHNLARNSKVSRAIMDAGWAGFIAILARKAITAGARMVAVNASGTSQTCPQCGGRAQKPLSERVHRCHLCGLVEDRDVAAAKVILQRGVTGGGPPPAEGNVAGYGERSPRSEPAAMPSGHGPHDQTVGAASSSGIPTGPC